MKTTVQKHFDNIAQQYDYFKEKNWYYYKHLKGLYKTLIPEHSNVLEIGCGTGDLISSLNARVPFGIDISGEMVRLAREKHPHILFEATTIETFSPDIKFDYIFLADVIEHLEDIPGTIKAIGNLCTSDTSVIFSYANPLWEPVLMLLEKLSLKMPEGPHYRIPYYKFEKILDKFGFKTIERGWRLLVPAQLWFFADVINAVFYHIPFLRRLGMLEYVIIRKALINSAEGCKRNMIITNMTYF